MNGYSRTSLAYLVSILVLLGCAGGGGGAVSPSTPSPAVPTISSFTATKGTITEGTGTTLTCLFANGVGTVDHGVGPIESGVPITTGTVNTNTTFTVTVVGNSHTETKSTTVAVVPAALKPEITAASAIAFGGTGTATVPDQFGCIFDWTITGGTFTGGGTTARGVSQSYTADAIGNIHLSCIATNAAGDKSTEGVKDISVVSTPKPVQPTIYAQLNAVAGINGLIASVSPQVGCTFNWGITNGSITTGEGTNQITFSAQNAGVLTISCRAVNAVQDFSTPGTASVNVVSFQVSAEKSRLLTSGTEVLTATADGINSPSITWTLQDWGGTLTKIDSTHASYLAPKAYGTFLISASLDGYPGVSAQLAIPVDSAPDSASFVVDLAPGVQSISEGTGAQVIAALPGQVVFNGDSAEVSSLTPGQVILLNGEFREIVGSTLVDSTSALFKTAAMLKPENTRSIEFPAGAQNRVLQTIPPDLKKAINRAVGKARVNPKAKSYLENLQKIPNIEISATDLGSSMDYAIKLGESKFVVNVPNSGVPIMKITMEDLPLTDHILATAELELTDFAVEVDENLDSANKSEGWHDLLVQTSGKITLTCKASVDLNVNPPKRLPLFGKFPIPIAAAGGVLRLDVYVFPVYLMAGLTGSFTMSESLGFTYYKGLRLSPSGSVNEYGPGFNVTPGAEIGLSGEVSVAVGIAPVDVSLVLQGLNEELINVSAQAGIELAGKGEIKYPNEESTSPGCVQASWFGKVEAAVRYPVDWKVWEADAWEGKRFTFSPYSQVLKSWGGGCDDKPPVPVVKFPRSVMTGSIVQIDASNSSDEEDVVLPNGAFSWTQIAGPPVTLLGATGPNPTFQAPSTACTLSFNLNLIDSGKNTVQKVATIDVVDTPPVNLSPLALAMGTPSLDAYGNVKVAFGGKLILNASSSADPDGSIQAYEWVQQNGPVPVWISDPSSSSQSLVFHMPGNYGFRLRVWDNLGAFADDFVWVVVSAPSAPVTFSDDFSSPSIDLAKWIPAGSTVSQQDGVLTISEDVIDTYARVTTVPLNLSNATVRLRHWMTPSNDSFSRDYFFPSISLNAVDGGIATIHFLRSYWSPDYCSDPAKLDRVLLKYFDSATQTTRCELIGTAPSSSFYNRWTETLITYDSTTGELTVDLDADGVIDIRFILPSAERKIVNDITISGYGWYTGHYHKVDSFSVSSN